MEKTSGVKNTHAEPIRGVVGLSGGKYIEIYSNETYVLSTISQYGLKRGRLPIEVREKSKTFRYYDADGQYLGMLKK